jgi:DNA polymerase
MQEVIVSAPAEQTQEIAPQEVTPPDNSWASLIKDLEAAKTCLACQDSNPILGEGDLSADWVWIIDAPSSQDITAQQLISGRAGQLFDAILQAVNLTRDQIYVTSVFKCPPSGDYTAQAACGSLLNRQLALIEPKKIVAFGEFAAQSLLRSNSTLEQLRGSVHQPRSLNCKVIATRSIQDMLSLPELKAEVWQDLCNLYRS